MLYGVVVRGSPSSVLIVFVFFFKQKTAYEMRISDWSSDVCSSDLAAIDALPGHQRPPMRELGRRSEAAAPVFRMARSDDGSASAGGVLSVPVPWGAWPTILVASNGQRGILTAACPIALELGPAPGVETGSAGWRGRVCKEG